MDYARYENQASVSSWESDQAVPIIQSQPQQAQPQQAIKLEPQHAQPILYGPPADQPIAHYDLPVDWTPQVVSQGVIQGPQWPPTSSPIQHTVTHIEPIGSQPISETVLHPSSQQSHYDQYSTVSNASTYWNSDFINNQPPAMGPRPGTTSILSSDLQDVSSDRHSLIDNNFTLNQASVAEVIPSASLAPTIRQQQPPPHPPPIPAAQFDDQLALGRSSQIEQLAPSVPEGLGSLEDALEVIKSHAEHYSGPRNTCSSTSGDDDDDLSRGPRSGEREKERRQANNARER